MLAGALFDWDGVIIDSHEAHERAWEALAAELGRPLPPGFFKRTFGMRNDVIIPQHTGWSAPGEEHRVGPLGDRKEALYREGLQRDGIAPLAGVFTLLQSLRDARGHLSKYRYHLTCVYASDCALARRWNFLPDWRRCRQGRHETGPIDRA